MHQGRTPSRRHQELLPATVADLQERLHQHLRLDSESKDREQEAQASNRASGLLVPLQQMQPTLRL